MIFTDLDIEGTRPSSAVGESKDKQFLENMCSKSTFLSLSIEGLNLL